MSVLPYLSLPFLLPKTSCEVLFGVEQAKLAEDIVP